jgi:cytochrome b subunit of formate dehydrogenase
MAVKKPHEMTDDELYKQERTLKVAVYMTVIAVVLMAVSGTIVAMRKGFNALTVLPITMLPLVIINAASLKAVRKEKQSRGLQ